MASNLHPPCPECAGVELRPVPGTSPPSLECTNCGTVLCASCGNGWFVTQGFSHDGFSCENFEAILGSMVAVASGASAPQPRLSLSDCPVCLDAAPLLRWGDRCEHSLCALCCVRHLRNELAPTRTTVGCPFDQEPMSRASLAAVAAYAPPAESGERALADAEVARAEFRLAVIAAGTARSARLVPCAACHAPLPAPGLGPPTLSVCGGRGGRPCGEAVCAACGAQWLGIGGLRHDAFPTCAAFRDAAAAVEARAAAAAADAALLDSDGSRRSGGSSFKQCPVCSEGISHYRGHACHHIAPGRGCPTCASRGVTTHFCFVCLGPWPCAGTGGNGCSPYCDASCDCPDCPDCAPNAPCDHCSGPLSGCRVCKGVAGKDGEAAWRDKCARTRAERMAAGWVGPRTGHRWRVEPPRSAATFPGVERRRRLKGAIESLQHSVVRPLSPEDSLQAFALATRPVIASLHSLTVELTAAAAVGARLDDIAACIGPVVTVLRPFTSAALTIVRRSGELSIGGPLEALSEAVMDCAEALSIDAHLVRSFGTAGGPSLLLALYNGAGATHVMKNRMLGVIYASMRVAMAGGVDLPEDAVAAFDAGHGLPTLLHMLAEAHAAGDGAARGRILGALAGIRIHKPLRWAALRAAGGPGALLEPILAVAAQPSSPFLATAIIALARALVGLKRVWTEDDTLALDAAVERAASHGARRSGQSVAASAPGVGGAALIGDRPGILPITALRQKVGALLSLPQERNAWEQVILASAISRIHSDAFTWLGPFSHGWGVIAQALPRPPTVLVARAALMRFHPASLRTVKGAGRAVAEAEAPQSLGNRARYLLGKVVGAGFTSSGAAVEGGSGAGLCTPLRLDFDPDGFCGRRFSPAVSATGRLYVPREPVRGRGSVRVFDRHGDHFAPIDVVLRGMHTMVRAVAVDDDTDALFLVAESTVMRTVRILSLNVAGGPRWSLTSDEFSGACFSLAVLSAVAAGGRAVVVLAAHSWGSVVIVGAADGRVRQTVPTPRPPVYVAAHAESRSVYASLDAPYSLVRLVWDGAVMARVDEVAEAGTGAGTRLLAVVPPVPGRRQSHLVICDSETQRLLVLALPGHARVHEGPTLLPGQCVVGLAADPSGRALVFVCCSASRDSAGRRADSVHVLAWPLEGMPPLE